MSAVYRASTAVKYSVAGFPYAITDPEHWQQQIIAFLFPFALQPGFGACYWDPTIFLSRQVGPVPKEEEEAFIQLYFPVSFPTHQVELGTSYVGYVPGIVSMRILFELPLGDRFGAFPRQRDLQTVPHPIWQGWINEVDAFINTITTVTYDGVLI